MCTIRRTTLGGGVICALCDPDCDCVVCVPLEEQLERPAFVLWHGGGNYALGYVADDTVSMPFGEVLEYCEDRRDNLSGQTPNVDDTSGAHVWFYDPREDADPYPDRVIKFDTRTDTYVMERA